MATLSLGLSTKSKDSSKEDDIQAICQQRGAGANAPLARQLQAIDEEYKHLLNSGQSQKSDYVQELYLFKSKQATQVWPLCKMISLPNSCMAIGSKCVIESYPSLSWNFILILNETEDTFK